MTVGSILLAVALLLLVVVYIFRPILSSPPQQTPPTQKERLQAQKTAIVNQIKTLDLDFDTGKIPAEQYEQERAQLKQAAAETLRQIDQLPAIAEDDTDAQIEAAVAALRGKPVPALACPNCGEAVAADDKFCRACGESL